MNKSVLQDWVSTLGLRHQGVLLTIVRGCDTVPKHDDCKHLARVLRGLFLNCHCGDPRKAATFIEHADTQEIWRRAVKVRKNVDHLPFHYVMHLVHAIEILGYYHPDEKMREICDAIYYDFCKGMHINPETKAQLDERLNADEDTFAKIEQHCDVVAGVDRATPCRPLPTGA